jgi:hypothetical protein
MGIIALSQNNNVHLIDHAKNTRLKLRGVEKISVNSFLT